MKMCTAVGESPRPEEPRSGAGRGSRSHGQGVGRGVGPAGQNAASRITYVPYDKAYEPGFEDMRRRIPDISKVKALIGWEPRIPLPETLEHVIDYYQAFNSAQSQESK